MLKILSAIVSLAICAIALASLPVDPHPGSVTSLERIGSMSGPATGSDTLRLQSDLEAADGLATVRVGTARVRTGTRNPRTQPFSRRSIWNMPVGTGARYVDAQLSTTPRGDAWSPMPMADKEHIVLRPHAPRTPIMYSAAGWGGDRCHHTDRVLTRAPVPRRYIVPSSNQNDSTTLLRADGRTLVQIQPFARCSSGGVGTALAIWPKVDIYGRGIPGAHGGSGLSAIGGTLRVGELRPSKSAPRHALKILVDAASELRACSTKAACFRWPATKADSYAVGYYGSVDGSAPSAMRMGALLAIPQTLDLRSLGLETRPGKKLAWTLRNYGAYIVDDVYSPGFGFATEEGPAGSFTKQFRSDYGFSFEARAHDTSRWEHDIKVLVANLSVVKNNSPKHIGGGGVPLQPLAAPLR